LTLIQPTNFQHLIRIYHKHSLAELNTFGLQVFSRFFVAVRTEAELKEAIQLNLSPVFLLGGGSNVLLTKDWPGLVILNRLAGKRILSEENGEVLIEAGAGENWHEFVLWSLDQGLCGLENLSLIPGSVGAAPLQNIGAYGVELKDVFERLEAIELATGNIRTFNKEECGFGYRNSVFKGPLKGQFCISRVVLRLHRQSPLNTSYGAIHQTLQQQGIHQPTARDVSNAVIQIRRSKLPDPAKIGNAGSFFKNPVLTQDQFRQLQDSHPDVVHYQQPDGRVKVPAGWLIEQCGWKGKRVGQTGAYKNQALVLVNYGDASGAEIKALSDRIVESVEARFGISLEKEVNVI
jgi:UDP-N-acetylmuramate dehydrogenase